MEAKEDIKVKILEIIQPCNFDKIKSFKLEKQNLNYNAGQHFFIETFPDEGKPFSLVSSPTDDFLEFATIIRDESKWKQALAQKQVGDELIVSGPYGKFQYESSEKSIVMIAGGIGITPFVSILRYLTYKNLNTKATLLYSSKTQDRLAFKEELDSLASKNENIKIIYTLTEEDWDGNKGRIDKTFLETHSLDVSNKTCYVAGPPPMVTALNATLKELGAKNIKLDSFGGY